MLKQETPVYVEGLIKMLVDVVLYKNMGDFLKDAFKKNPVIMPEYSVS